MFRSMTALEHIMNKAMVVLIYCISISMFCESLHQKSLRCKFSGHKGDMMLEMAAWESKIGMNRKWAFTRARDASLQHG